MKVHFPRQCVVSFSDDWEPKFISWSILNPLYQLNDVCEWLRENSIPFHVSPEKPELISNQETAAAASSSHDRQVGGDHYKQLAVEPWKAMKSWLTSEEWIGFLRGNIIKYHARANSGKGSREENLAKAAHYQQQLTETLEEIQNDPMNATSRN